METSRAVLRGYADRVEAETIRIRLAAAGIPAFVTGTDAATALGLGGAATWRMVRVEVPVEDYVRATLLLEEDQRRIRQAGPWICNRCREQNEAAFEVCWSCAKPRSKDDLRGRIDKEPGYGEDVGLESVISVDSPSVPTPDDRNPYRPVLFDQDTSPRAPHRRQDQGGTEQTRESVIRALRAAIVATILFPPLLNLYSIHLLLSVNVDAYREPGLRNRIIIAWCINLLTLPAWLFWWYMMIFT